MSRISSHRPRRVIRAVLAVVAFAATTLTITQCRNIADPTVELKSGGFEPVNQRHKDCTLRCDAQYRAAYDAELENHRAIIRACGNDMQCRTDEHNRYRIAKRAIEDQKTACKFACRYNEGAGMGGK